MKRITMLLFMLLIICIMQLSVSAQAEELIQDNFLDVGNEWTYDLHVTADEENGAVNYYGTTVLKMVGTEIVSGKNTVIVEWKKTVTSPFTGWENEQMNWFYGQDQSGKDGILEVRWRGTDDDGYEDNEIMINGTYWYSLPMSISSSDSNRYLGASEYNGYNSEGCTWTGSATNYITYVGQQTITANSVDYDCIVVRKNQNWNDSDRCPDGWEGTSNGTDEYYIWFCPGVGIIRFDGYETSPDGVSEYSMTLTSTNVVVVDPSIDTSKSSYSAGEAIVVNFSGGSGSVTDWIGLYNANNNLVDWKRLDGIKGQGQTVVTDGSVIFDGLPAGDYEVVLFFNNSSNEEASSQFSINQVATISTNKGSYAAGESIVVNFAGGSGSVTDWIGLYNANNNLVDWQRLDGIKGKGQTVVTDGSVTFGGQGAGSYEVRLFFNNSYVVEDSAQFVVNLVQASATISTNKSSYSASESIVVNFSGGSGSLTDWIGLYNSNNNLVDWKRLDGITGPGQTVVTSGSITFSGRGAGNYEVVLFFNNSSNEEASAQFSVSAGQASPTISTNKSSYSAGEAIVVNFTGGSGSLTDWIGLYNANNNLVDWKRLDGIKGPGQTVVTSGSVIFSGQAAGNYEVVLFFNNSSNEEASAQFSVSSVQASATISTNKSSYSASESIVVNFSGGSGSLTDWIGLYNSNNNLVDWKRLDGIKGPGQTVVTSGSITFSGRGAGNYEVRLFFNNSSNEEASAQFVVPDPNEFAYIPAGTFEMGDHHDETARAKPVHTVTLDSFYMSKYEITNQQYCDYLNSAWPAQLKVDGGIVYAADDASNSFPYCNMRSYVPYSQINFSDPVFSINIKDGTTDMSNHPMVAVSWYGSAAYCNWKSQQEGLESCYNLSTWECDFSKNGFRLPTEAQWEYAARGGEHSPYYRYPWGDSIDGSMANYWMNGDPYETGADPWTTPVGYYDGGQVPTGTDMANGYGLYDTAGNVYEWCNDWYDSYSSSSQTNPTGPASGSIRVLRGGVWRFTYDYCRVANRYGLAYPGGCYELIGFRVCVFASFLD